MNREGVRFRSVVFIFSFFFKLLKVLNKFEVKGNGENFNIFLNFRFRELSF